VRRILFVLGLTVTIILTSLRETVLTSPRVSMPLIRRLKESSEMLRSRVVVGARAVLIEIV